MATVKDIIDYVETLKSSSFTDVQKLVWFNRIEQDVKKTVMKTFIKADIARIVGVDTYDLPNGVDFNDIETVFFDKYPVDKLDQRFYIDSTSNKKGYYKTSSAKLGIQPTPTASDASGVYGIRIIYLDNFTPFTATSGTLMIPDQFKDVYEFYLISKIEWFNKELESYNNTIIQYNAAWDSFTNWYSKKQAIDKNLKAINLM